MRTLILVACLALIGVLAHNAFGGLKVNRKDVLFGNAKRTATPAEVDLKSAFSSTPEGREIEEEDIDPGSARHRILVAKGYKRLHKVVQEVAVKEGRDCVIKAGCTRSNPEGLTIVDITDSVISALE